MITRKVAQQALDALERISVHGIMSVHNRQPVWVLPVRLDKDSQEAIKALKFALEQPEPVQAKSDNLESMSEMNRTIAYSAASKLREMGLDWDGEAWVTLPKDDPVPVPMPKPLIDPKDIRVEIVLKELGGFAPISSSAVRVTHIPSGLTFESGTERGQHANRDKAMKQLYAALAQPNASIRPCL